MTRYEEFSTAWQRGAKAGWPDSLSYTRLKLIIFFINGIPNMTYPLGEEAYNASASKYGGQTVWAPHNLWRQPFHMFMGALLGILTFGVYASGTFGLYHEIQDLRERMASKPIEWAMPKFFADWAAFTIGGLLVHNWALLLKLFDAIIK